MKRFRLILSLFMAAGLAMTAVGASAGMDPVLKKKAKRAVDRGLHYLRIHQARDGAWAKSVGVTAIALRAFLESHRGYNEADGPFITKAVDYIVAHAHEDGSISESSQNRNYNTAVAIIALEATGNDHRTCPALHQGSSGRRR